MDNRPNSARDRLILSLDVKDKFEAQKLVKKLNEYVSYFKVSMYLFSSTGPEIFDIIHNAGGKVYFDGKFNDIPNTVARASEVLIEKGVTFFSVHTSGGSKMLKATVQAANSKAEELGKEKPIVMGVNILTSLGQRTINEEIGINDHMCECNIKLAKLAAESGLSGVVISGCEANEVRKKVKKDIIIATPGIRPMWSEIHDQLRVLTPKEAIECGADYLIIGRPITKSRDPITAIKLINDEIEETIERNATWKKSK
jgi:orotidine-5'-phosphate decarboxylase